MDAAHDIAHALNAFMPVYTDNWDRSFKQAWNKVVVDESQPSKQEMEW